MKPVIKNSAQASAFPLFKVQTELPKPISVVWGLHSIVPASFAFEVALEIMKAIALILTACAALALSGCATNQGAASDQYDTTYGTSRGNPASPTFRPGMYPDDIRDPNALTRPLTPPPTTPP